MQNRIISRSSCRAYSPLPALLDGKTLPQWHCLPICFLTSDLTIRNKNKRILIVRRANPGWQSRPVEFSLESEQLTVFGGNSNRWRRIVGRKLLLVVKWTFFAHEVETRSSSSLFSKRHGRILEEKERLGCSMESRSTLDCFTQFGWGQENRKWPCLEIYFFRSKYFEAWLVSFCIRLYLESVHCSTICTSKAAIARSIWE